MILSWEGTWFIWSSTLRTCEKQRLQKFWQNDTLPISQFQGKPPRYVISKLRIQINMLLFAHRSKIFWFDSKIRKLIQEIDTKKRNVFLCVLLCVFENFLFPLSICPHFWKYSYFRLYFILSVYIFLVSFWGLWVVDISKKVPGLYKNFLFFQKKNFRFRFFFFRFT